MEFYFGDSNISKDEKFREMMSKNKKGYIPLKLFLKFSKIQHFFSEASISSQEQAKNLLIEAIQKSEILRISKNLQLVKRAVPFKLELYKPEKELSKEEKKEREELENLFNDRMLYVENLPSFTTPELLGNLFSGFGSILHISLPKHKGKEIKGFAFVELEVNPIFYFFNFLVQGGSKESPYFEQQCS